MKFCMLSELGCLQDAAWGMLWSYIDEHIIHNGQKSGQLPKHFDFGHVYTNTHIESRDLNEVRVVDVGQYYYQSSLQSGPIPAVFEWRNKPKFLHGPQPFKTHFNYAIVVALLTFLDETTKGDET